MSCQQAPRVTEDPYLFTEAVPSAPVLFNAQKATRIPQQQRLVVTADNSTSPHSIFRLNGQVTLSSSLTSANQPQIKVKQNQRNVITINSIGCISNHGGNIINQSVIQQSHSSQSTRIISAANVIGTVNSINSNNSNSSSGSSNIPANILTKTNARPRQLSLSSLWKPPPVIVQHQQVSPTSPVSTPSPTAIPTSSPLLPPSNFHQTTLAQHLEKVGTSSIHNVQLVSQKFSAAASSVGRNNVIQKNVIRRTSSNVLSAFQIPDNNVDSNLKTFHNTGELSLQQKQQSPQQQQTNHSDLNEIPVNVIYRTPQLTGEITCALFGGGRSSTAVPQKSNVKLVSALNARNVCFTKKNDNCSPTLCNAENNTNTVAASAVTVTKRSPVFAANTISSFTQHQNVQNEHCILPAGDEDTAIDGEECFFAAPAKRDSRVLSSYAKKALKSQSPLAKAKRSYSQTSHHEALERISPTATELKIMQSETKVAVISVPISTEMTFESPISPSPPPSQPPLPPSSNKIKRKNVMRVSHILVPQPLQPNYITAYCVQRHWLGVYDLNVTNDPISVLASNIGREERITRHKALMRRQAFQLVAVKQFHRNPTAARKRLVAVSRLLQKFNKRDAENYPLKQCIVTSCSNNALALTAHCYQHITQNPDQHLFLPCTAKFSDNSQCRIPVFDITHELPLCQEHAWKRDNYNRIVQEQRPKRMMPLQHQQTHLHQRQQQQHLQQHAPLTTVKTMTSQSRKRKSNIINRNPQKRGRKPAVKAAGAVTLSHISAKQRKSSTTSLESIASNSQSQFSNPTSGIVLAPPALAPLSEDGTSPIVGINRMMNPEYKSNEISQIVAQFTMASVGHDDDGIGVFSSATPPSDNILTQDMLTMCDNSSAYASSEDTGVGGLSETELMAGNHDVEEIPLGDTRLLEEHDLTNVLNTLPVDAFSELFTAVRPDEREEVERALEFVNNQVKSLQQTICSDSDFLGDFLDVNDQILEDADICREMISHSPDTSGIDTSTLFVDGGSNSTAGSCTGHTSTDIRGLVQT